MHLWSHLCILETYVTLIGLNLFKKVISIFRKRLVKRTKTYRNTQGKRPSMAILVSRHIAQRKSTLDKSVLKVIAELCNNSI